MAASGQTLNDRILAAKHSLAGQGLAKAVCKATTEELMGPKRKHLDYLMRCTEEPNVSIPTLCNLLLERTQSQNWIVVFKSLVTIHHLMCYGNERFTQYLASSNTNFQLSNFLDKSGVQDRMQAAFSQAVILDPYARAIMRKTAERLRSLGYDMSPFVRRYAKYLGVKSVSYRTVAFDFCKVKRGKDGGTLRAMNTEKLLKTLPMLQDQVDALIEFEATTQDLNNGVINAAFMLLFRDLIRLFACYNDGIINLLEKYFEMNKKNARDALDIYKKFLIRMDRVAEFLKVAEKFGIDKSDIPDLARAPSSLLDALEAHLANLEGRKPGSAATTPTGAGRVNVAAAVNVLSSTSSAFGTSNANIDEKLQKQLLQEEEQAMAKYKENAKGTNPFAAASAAPPAAPATEDTPNILDMFGMSGDAAAAANEKAKASDDLLQLSGNPFASVMSAGANNSSSAAAPAPAANSAASPFAAGFSNNSNVNANGYYGMQPAVTPSASFGSDNSFINVFGAPPGAAPNPVMTPSNTVMTQQLSQTQQSTAVGANFFGDILQPQGGANGANGHTDASGKLVSGDLDASLANLTSNLNLTSGGSKTSNLSNAKPRGPPMNASTNNGSLNGNSAMLGSPFGQQPQQQQQQLPW